MPGSESRVTSRGRVRHRKPYLPFSKFLPRRVLGSPLSSARSFILSSLATMAPTRLDKGKARALPEELEEEEIAQAAAASSEVSGSDAGSDYSDSDSESSSSSSSDSDSDSESEDDVTPAHLEALLNKARENARAKAKSLHQEGDEEQFIRIGENDEEPGHEKET